MTDFAFETVAQCRKDIVPLLQQHWEEVELHREGRPLEPDWDKYEAMDAAGKLATITVRKAGELVGYAVFFIDHHIHYKSTRMAVNDVVFLRKDCRGIVGAKLLMTAEALLQARFPGRLHIIWHIKPHIDWSPILERLGYRQEEIIMGKLLEA